jgi:energy-coupling factor transporter ATP-binding protein EcfA2
MYIVCLDIENFRCVAKLTIHPNKGRNVLIGPANAGKSTILEALRLLLGPEQSYLREEAFSRFDIHGLRRNRGAIVNIGATLHLTDEEWRSFPELEEPYDAEMLSWAPGGEHASTAVLDETENVLRVALFYQWDREDPEDRAVAFFPKFDPPGYPGCRKLTHRQREVLGLWVAPYNEPLWEVASLSSRSHLSRAARAAGWDPLGPDAVPGFVNELVGRAEQFAAGAGSWEKLNELVGGISGRIRSIIPGLPGEASLAVTAALTDAWAQRMLELGFGPPDRGPRIPLSRQGAGMQRAFTIAARAAYAASRKRDDAGALGVLAIDEPEVGLHPQAQRALLEGLTAAREGPSPQVFVATHSPAVLQASEPGDVWVLRNQEGNLTATGLGVARGCADAGQERIRKNAERYWQVIAPALFARATLVVEGPTEEGAIPAFDGWASRQIRGYGGLDANDIALVNAGGIGNIAGITRVLRCFGLIVIAVHDFDCDSDGAKEDREHQRRRDEINEAAHLVLHMPDNDPAREFESMIALGTSPEALRVVLQRWRELYEPVDVSFAQWVLEGLPDELNACFRDVLSAPDPDRLVVDRLVQEYGGRDARANDIRTWFASRCGAKPEPGSASQRIFRKSTRYARFWAEACVEAESIPRGVQDLFCRIAAFVAQGFKPPPGGHVFPLTTEAG